MEERATSFGYANLLAVVCLAVVGVITMGLLAGAAIATAVMMLSASRKGHASDVKVAWIAMGVALLGLFGGWWLWQTFQWSFTHNPGAGGPVPPPSPAALAFPILVSAGLIVVILTVRWITRRAGPTRSTGAEQERV